MYIYALGLDSRTLWCSFNAQHFAERLAAGTSHGSLCRLGALPGSSHSIQGKALLMQKNLMQIICLLLRSSCVLKAVSYSLHVHANLSEWYRYSVAEYS